MTIERLGIQDPERNRVLDILSRGGKLYKQEDKGPGDNHWHETVSGSTGGNDLTNDDIDDLVKRKWIKEVGQSTKDGKKVTIYEKA